MDGRRASAVIRAVRLRERLRQSDVADRAGLSQRWVSQIERDAIDHVSLASLEAVCRVLGISLRLDLRWRGGAADRLLDQDHAAIVEHVVRRLRREGWQVRLEYGFNEFGERGSVDVLGWHEATRTLLIVEVKASLTDLQALAASTARKARLVPDAARRDGWNPARTAVLLVVLGSRANRAIVARHPETFDTSFPARAARVLTWLRAPTSAMRGLWFVSPQAVNRGRGGLRPKRVVVRPEPLPPEP